MRPEEISLNKRLLDNQEKSFLEADLKVYVDSLESPKLSKSANKMVWLREFVEGYNNWSGRAFKHNRYPLQSYFVIDFYFVLQLPEILESLYSEVLRSFCISAQL